MTSFAEGISDVNLNSSDGAARLFWVLMDSFVCQIIMKRDSLRTLE